MDAKRILVIDDCKFQLALVRDLLEAKGFEVVTAESGLEANNHIYGRSRPDLILLDVAMPMLDGDRKAKLIKERESSRDIPVILMSGKGEEELRRLVVSSGADGYVQKPINDGSLTDLISGLLGDTDKGTGSPSPAPFTRPFGAKL